jgi:hypothetical protein
MYPEPETPDSNLDQDTELDSKLDSELDSELDPDPELSHGNQRSKSLQNVKSVVALATGLSQFYNKRSSLWHSTLKILLLDLAIRSMSIFLVAIRRVHAADCQDPRFAFDRGAEQTGLS